MVDSPPVEAPLPVSLVEEPSVESGMLVSTLGSGILVSKVVSIEGTVLAIVGSVVGAVVAAVVGVVVGAVVAGVLFCA